MAIEAVARLLLISAPLLAVVLAVCLPCGIVSAVGLASLIGARRKRSPRPPPRR
ncbi:MAG: hypothetical protein JOZ42_02405 [Acetobacteraceae bacterium]|nr:hypothetical protein [Acetobacteraceae bacterium]